MKRSEIITIVSDEIRKHLRNEGIKQPLLDNILKELPEDIMRAVEKYGMLPPIATVKNGNFETTDYFWEPENEKN